MGRRRLLVQAPGAGRRRPDRSVRRFRGHDPRADGSMRWPSSSTPSRNTRARSRCWRSARSPTSRWPSGCTRRSCRSIKRIVDMGGAFEVPGNTTPSAEMNIWYDPEAARIVVREPIDQAFIPLDVTDTVPMNKALFERVTADPASVTAKILQPVRIRQTARDEPAGHLVHLRHARAGLSRRPVLRDRRRRAVGGRRRHLGAQLRPHARVCRAAAGQRPAEGKGRPAFRQRAVLHAFCGPDDAAGASPAAQVSAPAAPC